MQLGHSAESVVWCFVPPTHVQICRNGINRPQTPKDYSAPCGMSFSSWCTCFDSLCLSHDIRQRNTNSLSLLHKLHKPMNECPGAHSKNSLRQRVRFKRRPLPAVPVFEGSPYFGNAARQRARNVRAMHWSKNVSMSSRNIDITIVLRLNLHQ